MAGKRWFFFLCWALSYHICDFYSLWNNIPVTGDVGYKLILTPYIEAGNITEARNLAKVSGAPFSDNIPSYSGFLTVNKTYNSNLFFWFFPAEQNYEQEPLLLWLQGGPGASSLLGLFKELGPYSLTQNLTLVNNPYSWHKKHSLVFIDNPVGTGFSFTENEAGYAKEQVQIGNELYSALIQFLTLFPELQQVPFFVAGESYGGKHAPSLAYTIHQRNPAADLKVNLEGIAVGNGFTDPVTLLDYSTYLYQLGLIDKKASDEMKIYEEKSKTAIREGNFYKAHIMFTTVMNIFIAQSRYNNVYNFLQIDKPNDIGNYAFFVQKPEIRKAIHVGDAEFSNLIHVFQKLVNDFMNTVRPWLEVLLNNYRVLYYSGQLDIIVAYPMSARMYNELQFDAAEEYRNATRYPWFVNGELAGYAKFAGNFTEVLVRNSGHLVPMDQPKWAFNLINRFTRNNKYP